MTLTAHRTDAARGGRAASGAWFPGTEGPAPGARIRLICFSYAGGTPSVYADWQQRLGDRVQVVPVLLPGRGLRLGEAPYTAAGPLAADAAAALAGHGLTGHYALFGHSMGALLAYEVACELRRLGEPGPRHLFVSGSKAPHLYGTADDYGPRDGDGGPDGAGDAGTAGPPSDEALRHLVRRLGGLGPDEAMGSAYLERRLPVLRADLAVCAGYRWRPRRPLDCPMTAFSAPDDPIATASQTEEWRECTTSSLLHQRLPGGHFFLTGPARLRLLRTLRHELALPDPDSVSVPDSDLGTAAPHTGTDTGSGTEPAPGADPDQRRTPTWTH